MYLIIVTLLTGAFYIVKHFFSVGSTSDCISKLSDKIKIIFYEPIPNINNGFFMKKCVFVYTDVTLIIVSRSKYTIIIIAHAN